MKKKEEKTKVRKEFNKGEAFVKIVASVLVALMVLAAGASLLFALI